MILKKGIPVLAVLFAGCGSLPVPDTSVEKSIFAVPVISKNESSKTQYSFSYVMRIVNQDTQEKKSFNSIPQNGTQVKIIEGLEPGHYCIDGYFSKPIERDGYRYTYAAEYKPYESCFVLEPGRLTVWNNKLEISKRNDEKKKGSFWQRHDFTPLRDFEKEEVEEKLLKYKNIEHWSPIIWY
jgi:hypothetical protein